MLRHRLIAGLSVLAVLATGCGVAVAVKQAEGRSKSDHSQRCPKALRTSNQAFFSVTRAIRREIPRVFPNRPSEHFSHRDYSVWAMRSLARRGVPDAVEGFFPSRLLKTASEACGSRVARRSWAVAIDFPGAPAATLGTYVVYLAHTDAGWRIWYEWLPYASRRGFFPHSR